MPRVVVLAEAGTGKSEEFKEQRIDCEARGKRLFSVQSKNWWRKVLKEPLMSEPSLSSMLGKKLISPAGSFSIPSMKLAWSTTIISNGH
jgi:hypothetical protein